MSLPRFLYHGTTGARHDSIAVNGIQPRSVSKIAATSLRNHNIGPANGFGQSSPDHVYLTTAYPLFFAEQALHKNDVYKPVIYEIDTELLDKSQFCADEDVLILWMRQAAAEAAWSGASGTSTMTLFLEDQRPRMHDVIASRSLEALGTCAYRGEIPVSAISRALFITIGKAGQLILSGMDPVINLKNYEMFGREYEESVQWMFKTTERTGVLRNPDWDEQLELWKNPEYDGEVIA